MGLENIGKHIVGDSKWEKLYDGCSTPTSSPGLDQDPMISKDEEPQPDRNSTRDSSLIPPQMLTVEVAKGEEEEKSQDVSQVEDDAVELNLKARTNEGANYNIETSDESSTKVKYDEEDGDVEKESSRGHSPSMLSSNYAVDHPESPHSAQNASEAPAPDDKNNGESDSVGLVDNLFQILPYWYLLNRAFGLSNSGDSQDDTEAQEAGVTEKTTHEEEDREVIAEAQLVEGETSCNTPNLDNCSSAATQRLNSILILESLRQQIQNNEYIGFDGIGQTVPRGYLSELIGRIGGNDGESVQSWLVGKGQAEAASARDLMSERQDMEDEPLDLTSSKSRENVLDKRGSRLAQNSVLSSISDKSLPPFILDEQTSKVFRSNPRSSKGYTAQELQAALHDIQSGKLGTRRAAVIYGIPRSTLRNKVYKLGKDRSRFFTANHATTRTNINNNSLYNDNKEVGGGNSLLSGKLSHLSGFNSEYLMQQRGYDGSAARFLNSSSHLSDEDREDGSQGLHWKHARHSVYSLCNGEGVGDESRDEGAIPPKIPSIITQSNLSHLISTPSRRLNSVNSQQAATSSPGSMEIGVDDSCLSGGELEQGGGGVGHFLNEQLFGLRQRAQTVGRAAHVRGSEHHSTLLLHSQQRQHGLSEDASGSLTHDLTGKKSRPKRGKYRNYDREALIKAVRAVQNGEMSVHRAGSFFGVPHSTLEYKVKERHLLRRPKRKDATSPITHAKSSSPENSSDGTGLAASRHISSPNSSSVLLKTVGVSKGLGTSAAATQKRQFHHSMFPLTSDLRESLNRYLNTEQQTNGSRTNASIETHHNKMELDDCAEGGQVTRVNADSRNREEIKNGCELLGLDGLIGNRLSNLFQLNDILLRRKSNEPTEPHENLLDLTKK